MQTRPSLSIKTLLSPLLGQSVDWRGSQSGLASPPSGLGVPSVHGDPAGESDETHVSGKAGAGEKPRSIPAFYVPPAIHWRRCRQSPVWGKEQVSSLLMVVDKVVDKVANKDHRFHH